MVLNYGPLWEECDLVLRKGADREFDVVCGESGIEPGCRGKNPVGDCEYGTFWVSDNRSRRTERGETLRITVVG